MEIIEQNIYDFPKYYDLIYGSDWKAEFDFLEDCFERYTDLVVSRLFEPACGTGRLIYRFAKVGYEVGGVDLNENAIEFCQSRFARHELTGEVFVGDMTDFKVKKKYDAAFNTVSSFRHLLTAKQAENHLICQANALKKGGLYILGFHLTPTAVAPSESESWVARRGNLQVNTHMQLAKRDLSNRVEDFNLTFDIYSPSKFFQIQDLVSFRTYTLKQFNSLLKKTDVFEVVDAFDFRYNIDEPIEPDDTNEDVVFVLKKK